MWCYGRGCEPPGQQRLLGDVPPQLLLDVRRFAAGRRDIELDDREPEDHVVQHPEAQTDRNEQPRSGRQAPVDDVVDQTPAEKLKPSLAPNAQLTAIETPVSSAWIAYSSGVLPEDAWFGSCCRLV